MSRLAIEKKIQVHEILQKDLSVIDPKSFYSTDALCGVLCLVLKEICEYLGLIPVKGGSLTQK